MWPLRTAQTAIVIAGCLGTAFLQIITSAAAVQYTRALGGSGLHVGILNALPSGMLFMQLLAGMAASRLRYRRPLWFGLSLIQRTMLVPFVFGPWWWSGASDAAWVWLFLLANMFVHGLAQFGHPLWLSWMGDYLPRDGLSAYWGRRQSWMNWTIVASLMTCAVYVMFSGIGIRASFPHLCLLASIFGVVDLLLHLRVEEPPVTRMKLTSFREIFIEPLKHKGFRSFIGYACMWHFAAMIGAPFISLYLLQHIGMSLFQVLLLWSLSAVGGALTAGRLGRFAERFGSRPLLVFCTVLKPLNMLSLLVLPRDPEAAFWILMPAFMFDAALNVGIQIAQDGFLMKQSPARNRAMFIASGMALAGLVGCATSVGCGAVLAGLQGWSTEILGCSVNGFHCLFWASLVARLATVRWVCRIDEPQAIDHRVLALRIFRLSSRMQFRLRRRRTLASPARLLAASPPTDRAA
ncbi:MAG: MFS transporter [Planctomyces sp.]|nr:MFS transporter [Planctomyces sp.]